ncbi:hypothetical protein PR048_030217 [Dryococelus australis]|uniref:Uncharacterized protein n=1 Tax=Dryococelus australis TaxID=614101 RepID=A0ABQ9GB74_9NEOP|nr:hypothetical protein PR048_030217 [Dryococelus australis]
MARIVRADKMPKRDGKALLNFDLESIDNLSKVSSVDIGVLIKQLLKETKVSDFIVGRFYLIEKIKCSGVSRSMLFGVTSLDAKVICSGVSRSMLFGVTSLDPTVIIRD